ncbi:hypothetical protein Hanom_Chr15g01361041 [Helianthus anomalus]
MRWVYISEEVERMLTSFTVFILSLFFIRSSNLQATYSRSSSFLFISSSFSLRYSKLYQRILMAEERQEENPGEEGPVPVLR